MHRVHSNLSIQKSNSDFEIENDDLRCQPYYFDNLTCELATEILENVKKV
jgi:hypothetical protein